MVFRTIEIKEISFEVAKEKQKEMVEKINKLYPDLNVEAKDNTISVRGDLHNYKRRDMIVYILTEGKHGTNIQTS